VNPPIYRLFGLFVLLFAVLIGFTSRWAVFGAKRLQENPRNARVVLEQQRIKRGVIRADDGTILAGSTPLSQQRYGRRYPAGKLFAQPVGFDSVQFGRAGLEGQYNDRLTGATSEFQGIIDSLSKKVQVGDDLDTSLDPKAPQRRGRGAGRQERRRARAGRQPAARSRPPR
jgi:peptidoglycan glycosyltransferase